MSNLTWTTDKPTQSGYYWARGWWRFTVDPKDDKEVIMIVEVDIEDEWKVAKIPGSDVPQELDSYTHWKGPLTTDKPVIPLQ